MKIRYKRTMSLLVVAAVLAALIPVCCQAKPMEEAPVAKMAKEKEETPNYVAEKLSQATEKVEYLEDVEVSFGEESMLITVDSAADESEEKLTIYKETSYAPVDAENVEYSFAMSATEKEKQVLYQIVMAEAGCEDMKGQILVANVILNRVRSSKFANDITGVVFTKGQFSPVSNGSYYSVKPTASVKEAVERALSGEDYSQGALFFVSETSRSTWFRKSLKFMFQHGDHLFYKYR